jgi:16S rRNA pseudouridine516 synthase
VKHKISDQSIHKLKTSVTLDDGYETLPAECERVGTQRLLLTLHEGKFHQVKRMIVAVNNEVTHLKRLSVGNWNLDGLKSGEFGEVEVSDTKKE